jgi:hypothetical protein
MQIIAQVDTPIVGMDVSEKEMIHTPGSNGTPNPPTQITQYLNITEFLYMGRTCCSWNRAT